MSSVATYQLWDSPQSSALLGCWRDQLRSFTDWYGYSHLGNAFVRDPSTGVFAVVYPFRAMLKQYGPFDSARGFELSILCDTAFVEYCLRPTQHAAVQSLLGPLPPGNVYIPCPYPHLGGSDEPSTYCVGDFRVFMEIVGQTHGFS